MKSVLGLYLHASAFTHDVKLLHFQASSQQQNTSETSGRGIKLFGKQSVTPAKDRVLHLAVSTAIARFITCSLTLRALLQICMLTAKHSFIRHICTWLSKPAFHILLNA